MFLALTSSLQICVIVYQAWVSYPPAVSVLELEWSYFAVNCHKHNYLLSQPFVVLL